MSHLGELKIEENFFTEPGIPKVLNLCTFIFPLDQC